MTPEEIAALQAQLAAATTARTEAEAKVAALSPAAARVAELEAAQAVATEAQRAAAEEAAKKSGEYKALYEPLVAEHATLKTKVTEYETRETARVAAVKTRADARVAALPPEVQAAIKSVTTRMDPEALIEFLDNDLPKLTGTAVVLPAGTVVGSGRKQEEAIPPECTAQWKKNGERNGTTEREWFDQVWKPVQARLKKTA